MVGIRAVQDSERTFRGRCYWALVQGWHYCQCFDAWSDRHQSPTPRWWYPDPTGSAEDTGTGCCHLCSPGNLPLSGRHWWSLLRGLQRSHDRYPANQRLQWCCPLRPRHEQRRSPLGGIVASARLIWCF
ncbi:hypothetical protein WKK05_03410 [Nostoc sp. UHCC 0302]|uniref:hypothetical protein n=1 Tax=Nostoc sp. UHCC 0302 TaxID=3134896 RepID=UPI00311CCA48